MRPLPLRQAGAHLPRGRPRLVGLGHCNGGPPEVRPLDALRAAGRALQCLRRGEMALGGENWAALAPELLWPLWGFALGVATLAYYRRRGGCGHCGRA